MTTPTLNKVLCIGTVIADPEIRFSGASQRPVSDIRFAVKHPGEEPLFLDVTAWGRQAESAVQHLRKGRMVAVEGRLTKDEWTGPDGRLHSRIRIVSDRLVYLPQPSDPITQEA